jgi:hypothetical protein
MVRRASIRLLRLILGWLEGQAVAVLIVPADALLERATILTQAQRGIPGRAGEAKRHQVYARLIKEFPNRDHRDMARAIEAALER